MNKKNENYSDLELARKLSRELCSGASEDKTIPQAITGNNYVTFPPIEKAVPSEQEEKIRPMPPMDYQYKSQGWDQIVLWLKEITNAESAFITESNGMMIASEGDLSNIEPEALAGRLLNMIDEAHKLPEGYRNPDSISLEFENQWLTGIVLKLHDEVVLMILISNDQIKKANTSDIKKQIDRYLNPKPGDFPE